MPSGCRPWRMGEACRWTGRVRTSTARPGRRSGKWIAYQRLHGQNQNWELVKVPSGGGRPYPGTRRGRAWWWRSPCLVSSGRVDRASCGWSATSDACRRRRRVQKALSGAPPAAFGFFVGRFVALRGSTRSKRDVATRDVRHPKWRGTEGHQPEYYRNEPALQDSAWSQTRE